VMCTPGERGKTNFAEQEFNMGGSLGKEDELKRE